MKYGAPSLYSPVKSTALTVTFCYGVSYVVLPLFPWGDPCATPAEPSRFYGACLSKQRPGHGGGPHHNEIEESPSSSTTNSVAPFTVDTMSPAAIANNFIFPPLDQSSGAVLPGSVDFTNAKGFNAFAGEPKLSGYLWRVTFTDASSPGPPERQA